MAYESKTEAEKGRFLYPGMRLPFWLLVTCFAAWGIGNNMTDPLVNVFQSIFSMSALQGSLVQFAFYGAYFLLAIPAAFINSRLGYKGGVLIGLGLASFGGLMFLPASKIMTYGVFIIALFALAGGLSILETSANPYILAMGPAHNATRRLNFAQMFNPIGSNIGVLLAATLILPNINAADKAERATWSAEKLHQVQTSELAAVTNPYLLLTGILIIILIGIAVIKVPPRRTIVSDKKAGIAVEKGLFGRLIKNGRYSFGVVAQFFNIAAQICIWTYTIHYVEETLGTSKAVAGQWLQASLICFLIGRILMVALMGRFDSRKLMVVMCSLGTILTLIAITAGGLVGCVCIVGLSLCISLLFPTIYGVALAGLGNDAKFGSAGLVMAICGGAIMTPIQARIIDLSSAQFSYIAVLVCFLVLVAYGCYVLFNKRVDQELKQAAIEDPEMVKLIK